MTAAKPALVVTYIPANNAWAVLMGDALVDLDGQRLFTRREDLIFELNARDLAVDGNGVVSARINQDQGD